MGPFCRAGYFGKYEIASSEGDYEKSCKIINVVESRFFWLDNEWHNFAASQIEAHFPFVQQGASLERHYVVRS